jgi:Fur family transcriptional regulator, peroxide stress response regulator
MTCSLVYAPQLRSRGFRMTPQRMAILHVLHHAGTHLSPTEVYKQAKRDFPRLTEPTVYRTLEFLAHNGLARPTQAGNGRLMYQIAGNDHHHIACRICGSEIEVEHALLAKLYRKLESTSGYLRINSHVTFFGVCPKCQKQINEGGSYVVFT